MIRILHTADWHLGREFHGRDLTSLHEHFFDWLEREIESLEIDVLLMAGDIYDRALPPVSAVELFNERIARLSDLTEVVMITGNHDSVVRMGHGPLMKPSIHLRCGVRRLGDPVLIERPFPLAIYPVPYLDPPTMSSLLDLDENSHDAVLREAVGRCRRDLETRPGVRSVAVGHAFITGSEPSDSERSIQIGGSENVAASLFDGFDYVALGHLHRPQTVGDRIRYSGSPIPLSYSEVDRTTTKSVTVLDLSPDGSIEFEEIPIPQSVRMARIEGELDRLLSDPEFGRFEEAWLEVTLTDKTRPDKPMDRLRARFPEVVSLRFTAPLLSEIEAPDAAEIEKLEPMDVVARFLEHVRGEDGGPDEEERDLLERAFEDRTGAEVRA